MIGIDELPLSQRSHYQQGYADFLAGLQFADNPSSPKSYAGILWDWGWADAETDCKLGPSEGR